MTEAKLVSKQIALIKRRGGKANKIHGGINQKSGISDILACYKGWFCAIESKLPTNKRGVTQLQQHYLDQVNQAGGFAIVARNLKDVADLLDEIDKLERE